jgi:hypothetical protein
MIEEYEKRKRKQISSMRSIMDYAMGIIIVLFGAFLLFRERFDLAINKTYKPDDLEKIFGVICVIYGAWRIYRGYKKKYFH